MGLKDLSFILNLPKLKNVILSGNHISDLNPYVGNPTPSGDRGDVRWDIDFRRVYAEILDKWLGSNSVTVLGGDYRQYLNFIA